MATAVRIVSYGDSASLSGSPMYLSSLASATAIQIVGYGNLPASATAMRWSTPAASGAIPVKIVGYGASAGGGGGATGSTWSTADATASAGKLALSNGGSTVSGSNGMGWTSIRGTKSQSSGKYYFEVKAVTADPNHYEMFGLASSSFVPSSYLSTSNYSCGIQPSNSVYVSSGFTANLSNTISSIAVGDIIGIAVDFGAGSIWIAQNNVWTNSGNPATGALPLASFVPATVGALFPAMSIINTATSWTLQPTPASQTYLPPAGFQAWDGGPVTTGVWTPTSITGLVAWYDAQDGSTLTTASAVTAHRYWRLDNLTHGTGSTFAFAEMQFRTTAGTPLLFSGGTATASDTYSGQPGPYDATHLVDNNINTLWSGDPVAGGPHWVMYDYGAGVTKAIVEVTVTSRNDSSFPQAPLTFDLAYSDNNSTWTVLQTFTAVPWTQGQTQTFTVNRNVSQWNDKSGHAYNATQATGANQPGYGAALFNGLPALQFQYANNNQLTANVPAGTFPAGIAVYCVANFQSGPTYLAFPLVRDVSGNAAPLDRWSNGSSNNKVYFGNGSASVFLATYYLLAQSGSHQHGLQYTQSTDVYTDWMDGTQQTTATVGASASYGDTATKIYIGKRSDASTFFNGYLSEIVTASSALSTTDRQKLEGYLAWKWNLQDYLPPGHPFLAGPPDTTGAPIAKPWYPKLLTGLVSWWDAQDASTITQNNGQVSQWNDKSGNGHHAVQGTTANQPTYNVSGMNGYPDLGFSFGGSTAMQAPVPSGIFSAGICVFYVCTFTPNTDRAGIFGRWVGDNPGAWTNFYFKIYLGPTYIITAGTPLSLNTFSSPTLCEATYVKSTDLYYEFTNGNQVYGSGTAQGAASTYTDTATSFSFGASATGNYCVDGTLGEVITCTSVTTADRQRIEGYLAWKWGLQSSLPAGHPYKSAPP